MFPSFFRVGPRLFSSASTARLKPKGRLQEDLFRFRLTTRFLRPKATPGVSSEYPMSAFENKPPARMNPRAGGHQLSFLVQRASIIFHQPPRGFLRNSASPHGFFFRAKWRSKQRLRFRCCRGPSGRLFLAENGVETQKVQRLYMSLL